MRLHGLAVPLFDDSQGLPDFVECFYSGAFDRCVEAVRRGKTEIVCRWGHRGQYLGTTDDGSLTVWNGAGGLCFTLDPEHLTPAQTAAIRSGAVGVSIGFRAVTDTHFSKLSRRAVLEADVHEIAIVQSPAYPKTWVRWQA